jgi:hypothetical protein
MFIQEQTRQSKMLKLDKENNQVQREGIKKDRGGCFLIAKSGLLVLSFDWAGGWINGCSPLLQAREHVSMAIDNDLKVEVLEGECGETVRAHHAQL